MSQVTSGGSTVGTYVYNALGQMIKKSGSYPVLMMYDEAGHLVGEYTSSGALTQETIWLGDIPIATIQPNGASVAIFYIHTDQINAPRMISQPADNKLRWRWDDSIQFASVGPNTNPASLGAFPYSMRYPGQFVMNETFLKQNGFRDFDSTTGRYLESDPIGLNGGINTYAYAGNSPTGNIDPYGLDWLEYTGQAIALYKGNFGDRARPIMNCAATSGMKNYQNTVLAGEEFGPVPEGQYRINLALDPTRFAAVAPDGSNLYAAKGIQRIGETYTLPDGRVVAPTGWGSWRARLEKVRVRPTKRDNFYLHNSQKGFTHGCVETCDQLYDALSGYHTQGTSSMDVNVRYTTQSTYGGTDLR